MKEWRIARWPLRKSLLALILPAVLLCMLAFGLFCMRLYQNTLRQEAAEQLRLQTQSAAETINSTIVEASRLGFTAYSSATLRDGLVDSVVRADTFTRADGRAYSENLFENLLFFIDSPTRYRPRLYPVSDFIFADYSYVWPISTFPGEIDAQTILDNGYGQALFHVATVPMSATWERRALLLSRAIYHSDRTPLGILNMEIYTDALEGVVKTLFPGEEYGWYQMRLANGQVVFEGGERSPLVGVQSAQVPFCDGVLEVEFPLSRLEGHGERQLNALALALVLAIFACGALILFASAAALRRFHGVVRKYEAVSAGGAPMSEALAGNDEAAKMDRALTRLYAQYQSSLQAAFQLKLNERKLENNLLLSKINPHFLYNTLSAIHWRLSGEEAEAIDHLVQLYRGTLGRGRDAAPLESELALIEQYVCLQRYTYSREISLSTDVTPEARMLFVPKFLLQPVVEHAIAHSGKAACAIRSSARVEENALWLEVCNSGTPIDAAMMRNLNGLNALDAAQLMDYAMPPDDKHGYGVFNILLRIRLLFGKGYGLWFALPAEGGTLARFRLPVLPRWQDYELYKKIVKAEEL